MCLNAKSECPSRYVYSVINSYINRAFSHCSTWTLLHSELERITQLLVNNGYRNSEIQRAIRKKMDSFAHEENKNKRKEKEECIMLYYKNQMTTHYKIDERILKDIIERGTIPSNTCAKLQLRIYYKSRKTSNFVMKNNNFAPSRHLDKKGLVYQYQCQLGDCKPQLSSYIGCTTTSLSRRLTMHLQSGTIKNHTSLFHQTPLTRQMLVENTEIIDQELNHKKLMYLELIYIRLLKPSINIQGITQAVILPSLRER